MDKNIEIYIDHLVLDGFDNLNKAELSATVQEHLLAMISERGLPSGLLNTVYHRKLNGGEMNLPSRPKSGQVGGDIANGIFNGINSII